MSHRTVIICDHCKKEQALEAPHYYVQVSHFVTGESRSTGTCGFDLCTKCAASIDLTKIPEGLQA